MTVGKVQTNHIGELVTSVRIIKATKLVAASGTANSFKNIIFTIICFYKSFAVGMETSFRANIQIRVTVATIFVFALWVDFFAGTETEPK